MRVARTFVPDTSPKTIRLFWDAEDTTRFGLQINPHEPPEHDPEINAIFAAMNKLEIEREQVKVFTFNMANPEHLKIIADIGKVDDNASDYTGVVEVDISGNYAGFTLIELIKKPQEEEVAEWVATTPTPHSTQAQSNGV